jgi:hypothetical protein
MGAPVTEAEWYFYATPTPMLLHLGDRASERKLLLFACACNYRWLRHTPDARFQRDTQDMENRAEAVENRAGGRITAQEFVIIFSTVPEGRQRLIFPYSPYTPAPSTEDAASAAGPEPDYYWELQAQAELVRDIFGNPFRSVTVDPALLAWAGGTVAGLARAVYDERAFDRLPILADALEDAGCAHAAILRHCRGRGVHVRGCWVVDLLLGKS